MLRPRTAFAVVVLTVVQALAGHAGPQPPQASFRSRITIVPLDVRVVDRNGKPVTDLKQADFTIVEDGVPQAIRHFSTQLLTAAAPEANAAQPELRRAAVTASDIAPQHKRVFLLLLGRGRMKGPSKELPALLDFVGTRLLPQDQVAVLAYNRGTDFTTNHQALRLVIERYRDRHEKIETQLEEYFLGLRAEYGARTIPAFIQREIDEVFSGVTALRPRQIAPGQATDAARITEDVQRTADDLKRAELLSGRTGDFAGLPDPGATRTADRMDVSFEEYITQQIELSQDLGNLYAGIDYLRYVEGEKHLIFLTPKGIALPRLENGRNLAAVASDARVALDIIYVAGPPGAPPPRFASPGNRIIMRDLPTVAKVFEQTFTVADMRLMSEMTGGQLTAFQSADRAFSRLDEATRFQYLLGYSPSNTSANGAFRKIAVTVNRPGVTVSYRQGYYATPQLTPLDRRGFITLSRLNAAGRYEGAIADITVTLEPPVLQGAPSAREILVQGRLQSSRIKFERVGELYAASIDVGIFSGDAKQRVIGEVLTKIDLKLKEQNYLTFLKQGAGFNARVPITGEPKYVKAIVYDYASDLVGTAQVTLK